MKKGYIKLFLICIFLLATAVVNSIYQFFSLYGFVAFLLASLICCFYLLKYEPDRSRYTKDILLIIIIYSAIYYILTYLAGLNLGFNSTGYSLRFINILRNTTPFVLIILLSEILRYLLVKKSSYYISVLILITVVFIAFDITLVIRGFNLVNPDHLLRFIVTVVVPSIAKNSFLTYLVYKVGYKPSIAYRLIFEIPVFFLPIFPALGIYIDSVFRVMFPVILIFVVNGSFEGLKRKPINSRKTVFVQRTSLIISITFLLVIVALTSTLFKYFVLTIGSGSMHPNIRKGDVIVVRRVNERELQNLEIDDVLIFTREDVTVVHRITRIAQRGERLYFYTKGDANESEDGWTIPQEDVIGTTTIRIPIIGFPTVWLSELMN